MPTKTLKRICPGNYAVMEGEKKIGFLTKGSSVKVVCHYNERYTVWELSMNGVRVDGGSFARMKKLALKEG